LSWNDYQKLLRKRFLDNHNWSDQLFAIPITFYFTTLTVRMSPLKPFGTGFVLVRSPGKGRRRLIQTLGDCESRNEKSERFLGSAVSSLRTIHGAQATYQATTGNGNYAGGAGGTEVSASTAGLQTLNGAGLIDGTLGSSAGLKSGYGFTMTNFNFAATTPPNPATFAVIAKPSSNSGLTATGTRNFGIATDGVLGAEVLPAGGGPGSMALGGSASAGASYSNGTPMGN
jgi:hypothetical protein